MDDPTAGHGLQQEAITAAPRAGQDRLFAGGYRIPEPLCILSFGAGQDSTALMMKLLFDDTFRRRWAPGRLLLCFSDTGNEHPATYRHLDDMRELCARHGVELHVLEAGGEYHTDAWSDLISHYRRNDTVGSKAFRKSCSTNLKIFPWYRWLEALLAREYGTAHGKKSGLYEYVAMTGERITVLLGIAAGEEKRITKDDASPPWLRNTIERAYPLATDLGWDRSACQEYIRSLGYSPPIPSLCRHCPYKSGVELLLMSREDPEGFEEWVELERNKLLAHARKYPERPPEKNHGVFGAGTDLRSVVAQMEHSHGHLSLEELHAMRMQGHNVASNY